MRKVIARFAANIYIGGLYLVVPGLPILASVIFLRKKYIIEYRTTLRKLFIHIEAMREGPALHYFSDVLGRVSDVPEEIQGSCIQCGNCCMNHRCMFLEKIDEKKYQCGIYHSVFRRFSNCGSFPLNKHDIVRYSCPSYFIVQSQPDIPVADAVTKNFASDSQATDQAG